MHTHRHAPLVVALVVLLAACQPARRDDVPQPPAASRPEPGADPVPRPRPPDTVILGEATYRERIKAPPGAVLVVDLLDMGDAARVVASTRVEDVAGPPYPFALPYDAARVPASRRHALRATLLGPDGERWFETPAPVLVVPGQGTAVELLLRRSTGGAAPVATGYAAVRHWECGELGVMSRAQPGGGVRIDANARTWRLDRVGPPSGARHADRAGNVFDAQGPGARLAVDGEPARDCVPARQPSPWNAALLRGVAFRAVGNEPGWGVEVEGGGAPRLRATLDYGERDLDLPASRAGDGFVARAGDGRVRLEIERRDCTDGMSGQRFESSATLHVGSRRHTGCGGWLDD